MSSVRGNTSSIVLSLVATIVIALSARDARAQAIPIWPGTAPGSEHWTQKRTVYENTPVGTVVMNTVTPTITAYLPDRAHATGTGVIIAPGGAFVALTVGLEGADLAHWLQQRGIAAFVLEYRTIEKHVDGVPDMDQDTAARYGIADAIQALKVVRQHAKQWNVAPDRIGIIGFSAGGMVASGALLQPDSAARPSFAALIYGAPFGVMPRVPAKLSPVFMAWAQDDQIARKFMVRFRDTLVAAGDRPEVHVYSAGGHGFGMKHKGTTSDRWIDDFYSWLKATGLANRSNRS